MFLKTIKEESDPEIQVLIKKKFHDKSGISKAQ